ncbi:universal stress protein [Loigolactobacillus backii]|uniref:Uncharacterized protein n=1 Tax=Loigolactobacillus backii TaxID=375175 RepID=A0A192H402_9LACO|nr:universal stress protein [Loigolactobacillus backii]ANK59491.1 hypothetical protein AYR52_04060 [Loigolactobacillus backii]ANK62947.1 hypothetical protein AYR53_09345 [Loigolactobacillus backii]ANK64484.1 hypothetical protein AYR54_04065 [Loigolactobacillus backii]ANK67120.1 hypothetical protein AYR55_04965 [Loigolactobacillus backii]ANK70045.1 hypothetical protein AYR56_07660 [Loigolactobacillus backii]
MYKTILVPTDGSPNANHAVEEAIQLAKVFGSTLYIVSIVNDMQYVPYGYGLTVSGNLLDNLKSRATELLEVAEQSAKEQNVNVKTVVKYGVPKNLIAEDLPKEYKADLIVIGKSGIDALSRLILGSTTAYVVRHATTPLLVVTDHEEK